MTLWVFVKQATRDWVLETWIEFLMSRKPKHLSLHFDGVRINDDLEGLSDKESLLRRCEEHIEKETGFKVSVAEKQHLNMLELISQSSSDTRENKDVPAAFLQGENSILCGLWRVVERKNAVLEAMQTCSSQEITYFDERRRRTYRQCASMLKTTLTPVYGLPREIPKELLLHVESEEGPVCLSIKRLELVHDADSDASLDIFHGATAYRLTWNTLKSMLGKAADESLIVSFLLGHVKEEPDRSEADDYDVLQLTPDCPLLIDDENEIYFQDTNFLYTRRETTSFR